MEWPFTTRQNKRRDTILGIDLGARTTKAVQLRRRGDQLCLESYVVMETPADQKNCAPEVLGEHLKKIHHELGGGKVRQVTIALGVNDSLFRQVEMPLMPVSDLRQMLKYNSRNYLQQDLPDYAFDCFFQVPTTTKPAEGKAGAANGKHKVLVGGAPQRTIDALQTAIKAAGLTAEQIVPGVVGPVNTFEVNEPELYAKDVVALVDLGFQSTSITILDAGEIALHRVVGIGGDHLSNGLASVMGISYAEAESIKVGMPAEVQPQLEALLMPLGRELRASIDFFEHQRDKTVSQVFISGGPARSDFVTQILQAELIVPCKNWNPVRNLKLELNPQKAGELDQLAPQLSVALGAAAAAL